jgi:hypothetical protein
MLMMTKQLFLLEPEANHFDYFLLGAFSVTDHHQQQQQQQQGAQTWHFRQYACTFGSMISN